MNAGFVYRIVNAQNGKMYIGRTVRTLSARWAQHVRDAKKGSSPLYAAIRKYGVASFHIEALATVEAVNRQLTNVLLNNLEGNLIREYGTYRRTGYNATPGGKGFAKGTKLNLTDEQRKRRSERIRSVPAMISGLGMLGKKHRPETIAKFKELNSNRSPEHNLRIAQARKGKPTWASTHREIVAEQTRARKTGIPRTAEEKRKISEARMGRFTGADNPFFGKHHTEETRAKMRGPRPSIAGENHPLFGRHHIEETKKKIRATKASRKARKERRIAN